MTTVGIVGAGITGLTAAYYLQRRNISVSIYESAPRAGGMIQTTIRDGFLVEHGPNTILESNGEVPDLIRDLGLESRRLYPTAAAKARYIARDAHAVPLPQSPVGGVRTPLLSMRAKLRIAAEPFIGKGHIADETLSSFVRRRLGPEVLDYCIDPFVGGVYAGDPGRLSVAHAFPKLQALEQRYGSLIKGTILGAGERKKRGTKSKASAPMMTFDRGLGVLIEALESKLGETLHLGSQVNSISRENGAWRIDTTTGEHAAHSVVLMCAPAYRTAQISIEDVLHQDLARLRDVFYPSVARVALGFHRDQVEHSLAGFGVLIPSKERMNTLGILFSSSLFPGRAPHGYVVLTAFLGGARTGERVNNPESTLVDLALADMRTLLGVSGDPVFQDVARVPLAIPQYNVGYQQVKDAISNIEARARGVFVAGSYRTGISVADCIAGGKAASETVSDYVFRA